jgi:hypothetical protein
MVLKIYHVGKLSTTYEHEQMIKLIGYLRKEIANRTENCTLIINPRSCPKLSAMAVVF